MRQGRSEELLKTALRIQCLIICFAKASAALMRYASSSPAGPVASVTVASVTVASLVVVAVCAA